MLDPVKLTFDSIVYNKDIEEVISNEIIRQIDKSNNNEIWYFHQNIFKYIWDWRHVPIEGYDVVHNKKKIYVEMKNKHNTMNGSSWPKTYIRMLDTLLNVPWATCILVEVIAKKSQNIRWETTVDKVKVTNENIRRMSADKFYELVTWKKTAFYELCSILPTVIEDVVQEMWWLIWESSVIEELSEISDDILKSIYKLSFWRYEWFDSI